MRLYPVETWYSFLGLMLLFAISMGWATGFADKPAQLPPAAQAELLETPAQRAYRVHGEGNRILKECYSCHGRDKIHPPKVWDDWKGREV